MLCFGSLNIPCVYLPEKCILHLFGIEAYRKTNTFELSCLTELMAVCSQLYSIRCAEFSRVISCVMWHWNGQLEYGPLQEQL